MQLRKSQASHVQFMGAKNEEKKKREEIDYHLIFFFGGEEGRRGELRR